MKRHKHNLSHYRLFTGDMGQLLPIACTEVLPGDTFQQSTNVMMRFSPMVAPVMHPIDVRVHHFYVPNRITWPGWEDFITGGPTGTDDQEIPTVVNDGTENNLLDYLGVPVVSGLEVNALPIYALNLIYNEYYRDQDLVTERAANALAVPLISWEKDYFTSARPWEQKGDDISLPIGQSAPVTITGAGAPTWTAGSVQNFNMQAWNGSAAGTDPDGGIIGGTGFGTEGTTVGWGDNPALTGVADLAGASGVNVNEVRRAFALQRYQEARARYGSRYTEYLRYLGVNSSDARLQRPEYLGGGRQTVSISEVLQTAPEQGNGGPNDTDYGVGDMYGHGIAAMRSNKYRRFFEEHGYVITLASVRPKSMYVNGMSRHWLKRDKEDYYQKELAYIGQQPVIAGEVYADGTPADQETFGYQDRYIEYKRQQSYVSAEFRNLQNYWHLGREFESRPALNQSFVECDPSKRIFAEQTQHHLWCMAQHKIIARRMVPKSNASRII